jgi:hypothetical protein
MMVGQLSIGGMLTLYAIQWWYVSTLLCQMMAGQLSYFDQWWPEVGEVPTKRSSDHDPMIRHCRIIGRFDLRRKIVG